MTRTRRDIDTHIYLLSDQIAESGQFDEGRTLFAGSFVHCEVNTEHTKMSTDGLVLYFDITVD